MILMNRAIARFFCYVDLISSNCFGNKSGITMFSQNNYLFKHVVNDTGR